MLPLLVACDFDGDRTAANNTRDVDGVNDGINDNERVGADEKNPYRGDDAGDVKVDAAASYDAKFIDAMVSYARFSEDLADVGARRAQRDELKVYSQNLAKEYDTKVDQLKNWRGEWYKGDTVVGTKDFDEATKLPGAPPYTFGVAWKSVTVVDDERDGVEGVAVTRGVETWDADRVLSALKDVPAEQFDQFYTATLIEHSRWAIEAARGAVPRLEHTELQTIAQDFVNTNMTNINQLRQWQNTWGFGTTAEPYGGPATR
jgi:uncharacterized protein (DUF305 family)